MTDFTLMLAMALMLTGFGITWLLDRVRTRRIRKEREAREIRREVREYGERTDTYLQKQPYQDQPESE